MSMGHLTRETPWLHSITVLIFVLGHFIWQNETKYTLAINSWPLPLLIYATSYTYSYHHYHHLFILHGASSTTHIVATNCQVLLQKGEPIEVSMDYGPSFQKEREKKLLNCIPYPYWTMCLATYLICWNATEYALAINYQFLPLMIYEVSCTCSYHHNHHMLCLFYMQNSIPAHTITTICIVI